MTFTLMLMAIIAVLLLIVHAIIARKNRKIAAVFTAFSFLLFIFLEVSDVKWLVGLHTFSTAVMFGIAGGGVLLAVLEFILAVKGIRIRIFRNPFSLLKLKILPLVQALEKRMGKSLFGLVVSLLATVFILSFSRTEMISRMELQLLDLRNYLRYTRMGSAKIAGVEYQARMIGKSPDIAVIKMDSITFADKTYGQMPWARTAYTIPLNHFSKGQVTVSLGWLNSPQGGVYRIYSSKTPIRTPGDLRLANPERTVRATPHQTYTDILVNKAGIYYFAVTPISKDGTEDRTIAPGKNSTTIPIIIRFKPALKPQLEQWMREYSTTVLAKDPADTVKKTMISGNPAVDNLQAQKPYPKAFFYDVFFIDRKSKVFRTPKGEYFDPYAMYDRKLVEAFRRNDGVFVDYVLTDFNQANYPDLKERLKKLSRFGFPLASVQQDLKKSYSAVDTPFPDIIAAVDGAGTAKPVDDADKTIRKFNLVTKIAGDPNRVYPSAVLLLAMRYFNVPHKNVVIRAGEYIRLKEASIPQRNKDGNITGYKKQDVTIPIDREGCMRITFIGGADSFLDFKGKGSSFVSFTKYQPSTLNHRIYMIGLYEEAVLSKDRTTDFRKTPLGEMFGIEIMANALNTIVTRQFLHEFPFWTNMLITLLIGILLGVLLPRFSILKGALILFIILTGIFVAGVLLYEANLIINMAMPILATLLMFMALSVYKTLSEETEKKQIRNLFGKMANDEVVDEMLKSPDQLKLGGERRDMTVLFSDIRGFTTISESINNPEELVQLLNEYLNAMTVIVKQNQGILDKYVGDEIMAFWGAPLQISPEDQAFLACKTAIVMMDKLHELNMTWPEHKRLNIGIGVNTGPMLVGYMGSESRMDYTVIGDSVNLGARLEGANKYYKTNIIINEDTHVLVKDRIFSRELDLVRVKGKQRPVTIYELVALKES